MNVPFKVSCMSIAVASIFMANVALAADEKAGVIRTESGIDFTPGLNSGLKYDDNITSASASADELDSWVLTVTPALQAQMQDGNNVYTVEAGLEYGDYFSSSDDNYLDALLKAKSELEFNQSNRAQLEAFYVLGHEDRGSGVFEGTSGALQDEANTFDILSVGGFYEYGAMTTPARVRLNAKYSSKDYTNFETITQYRSYDDTTLGATFYYDTQAATSLFIELISLDTAYDEVDPTGNRDSTTNTARLGVEWTATAATEGSVKVGYQAKDFDNTDREDFSGLSWDAKVTWKPLTYSSFDFSTGRASKDPNGAGDFIRATSYGVTWNHEWSELFATFLGFNQVTDTYTGIDREDKTKAYQLGINYNVTRWLTLKSGVNINQVNSTDNQFAFDRNAYFIKAEMTL
ncbi:outer membrane beta-barrel protein [Shewanella inventionis]|uniref:outer membrane beta-barrel protein n=1 Tax=Shewanella inventionis TaxID=1738770 RepID=UPI001CC19D73|nr:outer membrane beta-barrel protein [Shewanella inventionis]UAL45127.1 outer membrane beta-barrel protein [Shewanella inventionis]